MSAADRAADLVVVGAPVYTADPARRWADAVAVGDGRVAAVGAERDVLALRGPATRVLRLRGGSGVAAVTPARASARLLTQALCPSVEARKTGRSATTASSSARCGTPPGKASMTQPPPVIQGASGWSAA